VEHYCTGSSLLKASNDGLAPSLKKGMALFFGLLLGALGCVSAALSADVPPMSYQIQPTTLTLSADEKSGAFSVINDGNDKIDFQIEIKAWSQDEKGKDVYEEAKDVIVFPKIMSVAAHEQRAIRIGIKSPPSQREKTYRLFVQEIPTAKKETEVFKSGKVRAGLTIAFRFATPIFVQPIKPQLSVAVDSMEMKGGMVKATVRNTGNVHIKLLSLTFRGQAANGKELFSKEVAGWYLLNGMAASYEAAVPKERCKELSSIEVKARAADLDMNISRTLSVQKSMCAQ
jgi:fimbrial chaperone protein